MSGVVGCGTGISVPHSLYFSNFMNSFNEGLQEEIGRLLKRKMTMYQVNILKIQLVTQLKDSGSMSQKVTS